MSGYYFAPDGMVFSCEGALCFEIVELDAGQIEISIECPYVQASAILDYGQQLAEEIKLHFLGEAPPESTSSNGREMEQSVKTDTAAVTRLPRPKGRRMGANGDMTADDVRGIVAGCRKEMAEGYTIEQFYDNQNLHSGDPGFYELGTLRKWLKDNRFTPEDI